MLLYLPLLTAQIPCVPLFCDKTYIIILAKMELIRKKLLVLFLFGLSPRGPIIERKIIIFCEFSPHQAQL